MYYTFLEMIYIIHTFTGNKTGVDKIGMR